MLKFFARLFGRPLARLTAEIDTAVGRLAAAEAALGRAQSSHERMLADAAEELAEAQGLLRRCKEHLEETQARLRICEDVTIPMLIQANELALNRYEADTAAQTKRALILGVTLPAGAE